MKLRLILAILAASLLPLWSAGCIVVAGDDWSIGWTGSSVWTDSEKERLPIAAEGLTSVEVFTHNGALKFEGPGDSAAESYVEVTKKTGGHTLDDAREAMASLEVFIEPKGVGTQRIGYRWRAPKRAHWSAKVSFHVHAPANVDFRGETHNGSIQVSGATSAVLATTHNGEIKIESSGGQLAAETHNGDIVVQYAGPELKLETHNGRVSANLSGCGPLWGDIATHNGDVEVSVGGTASARIDASTHNGGIKCDIPLDDCRSTRRQLSGKIGAGQGTLEITTHNGGVRIRNAAG